MTKPFRPYNPDQPTLLPLNPQDWLPKDHLAFFIDELGDALDLSEIHANYPSRKGQPPYHPRMMLKVWLYGYCTGIRSSRKLEDALHNQVPLRVLSGNQQPDHWTLSDFRRRHAQAMTDLFQQTIQLAQRAGLVPMRQVATDSTKVKANASKHRAMSYGYMCRDAEELAKDIEQYFADVEANDQAETEQFGDRRPDQLPEHLSTKQQRLEAIRQAKAELEARARQRRAEEITEKTAQAEAEGRTYRPRKHPEDTEPRDRDQYNFTDPESRIMKDADRAFIQAYNGQASVDADTQVIVANDLTNQAADSPHAVPMLDQTRENTGRYPEECTLDAGYFSTYNVEELEARGMEVFMPPDKIKHRQWREGPSRDGPAPPDASARERMRHKLDTEHGRERYKRRWCSVEPVFGHIKAALGFRQFLLRGQAKAQAEWHLVCAAHNALLMYRRGVKPRRHALQARNEGLRPEPSS